jgi:hypothetical protein
MRLSDLLDTPVYDATGTLVGKVHDVRLAHDMAPLPSTEHARTLRLEHLVLRNASVGGRLGYGRRDMKGPWLLARIFGTASRRAPVVAWDDIATREPGRITLHRRGDELQSVADLADRP